MKEMRSTDGDRRGPQAMAGQGSGGAYEISQRMTAMLGWGATTQFQEDWTWNQAAETYALDPEMAEKLRKANPQVPPPSSSLGLRGGLLRFWAICFHFWQFTSLFGDFFLQS